MALSNENVLSILTKQVEAAAVLRLENRGRDISDENIREEAANVLARILTNGCGPS